MARSPAAGSAVWDGDPGLTRTRRSGVWGAVLLSGVLFLLFAPLIPAAPKARRPEVERELAVFSHPARQRNSMCRPGVDRAA
jgi:hypothetical protein